MTKAQQILKEYKKTVIKHPSMRSIAKKVGCSVSYVHDVIKKNRE